jgi:hypothetical protein
MTTATFLMLLVLVAAGAWLASASALKVIFRPRRPGRTQPVLSDRDEPPAVVNLITNGWDLTPEAAPATLLDLADRGLVEIVQLSPEHEVIELRSKAETKAAGLRAYERQMLQHLRKVASNGVVPARALTTGPEAVSTAWWRKFRADVVRDAHDRGLSRSRYPAAVVAGMGFALGALILAAIGIFSFADDYGEGPNTVAPWVLAVVVATLAACSWVSSKFDRLAQRDTPEGLVAAAHWLGVRDTYTDTGNYEVLPPAAVILYERHLAYAAAMGVARTAVARLPLGAEDPRHAWSSWDGRWRQVEVRYPRRRAAWGTSPARAIWTGLLWSAVLVVPALVARRYGAGLYDTLRDTLTDLGTDDAGSEQLIDDGIAGLVATGITAVVTGLMLVLVFFGIRRGVLPLVRGLADLGRTHTVRGVVVRRRTFHRTRGDHVIREHFVGIDDGSTDDIVALHVREALVQSIDQGDEVEVEVTRHLGYVRTVSEVVKPPPLGTPALDELEAPPPAPPPPAASTAPEPWWGNES